MKSKDPLGKPLPYTRRLVITGAIPAKKNKQRIAKGGKHIYKPGEVRSYENDALKQLLPQRIQPIKGPFKLGGQINIAKRKDLDGALVTLLDILKKAGIIEDDRYLTQIHNLYKIIEEDEYREHAILYLQEDIHNTK